MIEVRNFSKTYSNNKVAVDDISFDVRDGEIFGFLGPNGAGKSSTIKAIVGINKPTSGSIKMNGLSLDEGQTAYKSQFSYIPDNPELFENYTGYEYINFLSDIYGVDEKTRKERLDYYLEYFDIRMAMGDQIETYSHGMAQRLALIGGLINDPEVLILDEPMVGLDAKSSYNLKQILRERASAGKSIFFSTHVMSVAQELCDRIAIINKGKIIAIGTFDEIKSQASHKENLEAIFLELTDE
ncbi:MULTISPECIES: ABC transporter ATP-binding protein [Anaerococcus]|uniref:ABC transporter ATP-binding protein n=1 Tax=Anaerococcus nagyae TaxID=1755241 RepID=A0A3E2TL44_9FIRM|nr:MULTISPECIES: ABC transporter ATP-binding protein [Anaerococcus]MBP2069196.1 ABC-2 type transport system ATP-binding protein [Anaerococcus nagyae]MDU1828807.1 ABC transporter ATP-binding protein [Anaerococcus sp.]MDU1865170.1 ABC transporter ATP-binding protein [Anaerococcus sp.]MDU3210868.1 ABC transporter ATP-binding protein [Anaerococcus sp.]RGB78147.1 ABC transporter ATP-binding protein [Anaerococcus nagyae]